MSGLRKPPPLPPNAPESPTMTMSSSGSGILSECFLEGYLMKKGEKGAIKRWKNRWCKIKGSKLFYYQAITSDHPQGVIGTQPNNNALNLKNYNLKTDLLDVVEVSCCEVHTARKVYIFSSNFQCKEIGPTCFKIVSHRVYLMQAKVRS